MSFLSSYPCWLSSNSSKWGDCDEVFTQLNWGKEQARGMW